MTGGFSHAIAGGSGKLIVSALQSPNFNPATSTGWSIGQDGTATFYQINLPGAATGTKVTFASAAPAAPNVDDVWYDTAAGLVAQIWNGSAWVPYQIGTDAIANGAITSALIEAGTVVAGIIDGTVVNAGTFTGSVFQGTNWLENSAGQFMYSGTPAAGNLILSVAPAAGTDAHGNGYAAGLSAYGTGGSYVGIAEAGSQASMFLTPPNVTHQTSQPQLTAQSINGGAANERGLLLVTSGKSGGNDDAALQLFSESADATIAAQAVLEFGGAVVLTVTKTQILPNVPIVLDSWHAMSLTNGWSNNGSFAAAQYRKVASPPNSVEIIGAIAGNSATNGTFFTLPAGTRPNNPQGFAIGCTSAADTTNGRCDASGNLSIANVTMPAAQTFFFHALISLDA